MTRPGVGDFARPTGLLAILLYIFPSNEVETEYANYDAAVAAKAFELERIPTLLPTSATKIWSVRNLDLNYEVVTFQYGPDFDTFIAAQVRLPGRTARSFGIRPRDDRFENPHELVYIPNAFLYARSSPGKLVVNHVHRVALYFD